MRVSINGSPRELPDGTSVERLLLDVTGSTRGSAVVVDGEVVPRSSWADCVLRNGQTLELITAVQGG